MVINDISDVVIAFISLVPSTLCTLLVWKFKKYMDARSEQERQDRREETNYRQLVLEGVLASCSFNEECYRTIKDEHQTDALTEAHNYMHEKKNDIKNFVNRKASESIK